jgi:phospholipid/cholesterol/gamma-HCH transport system ATP-binding protein
MAREIVIKVEGLRTQFGEQVIHDNLSLEVYRGEVLGVVGGSGSGKSVLLRSIVGLNRPTRGKIWVLGHDLSRMDDDGRRAFEKRWGMLFQSGALFSSLTVEQNVQMPLKEHTKLAPELIAEIAHVKLGMVGLKPEAHTKYPSEISGGMKKRAALARALALDPELLFLDEPTAGLDPIAASHFDELIAGLKESLNLTVFMVTHDLDTLHAICDRVAVLVDRRVIVGTIEELVRLDHPWIKEYFGGPRGRRALAS